MRTLQLTHEQIELICKSLKMSNDHFTRIDSVLNNSEIKEMASKIYDLKIDIEQGKLDI